MTSQRQDAKRLIRALRRNGYKVAMGRGGHAAVYDATGKKRLGGFSMTPPRTYDIRDNAIPSLRRAGVRISTEDL